MSISDSDSHDTTDNDTPAPTETLPTAEPPSGSPILPIGLTGLLDPLLEISLTRPERLVEPDAWVGHIPFAFWIVAAHRPRVLVELGTHSGNSYGAFCQGVTQTGLDTACYAVDTWTGDAQAGFYGNDVFEDLSRYHDPRYGAFSRLVRTTFDEALVHFPDGSIDLLHVDGYHTYDAVRHDFEAWLPKLSRRGVVLFHDINVRERDFGAWRHWDEVAADRPHFAFLHSHGLGVLGVGEELPDPIRALLSASPSRTVEIRHWFASAGQSIQHELLLSRLMPAARERDQATSALEAVTRHRAETEAALESVSRHRAELEATLGGAIADRAAAEAEVQRLGQVHDGLERDLARLNEALVQSEAERSAVLAEIQKLHGDRTLLLKTRAFLSRQLEKEKRRRRRLRTSLSWRATKPLRLVGSAVGNIFQGKRPPKAVAAVPVPLDATPTASPVAAAEVKVPTAPPEMAFVPLLEARPVTDPVARVVAFYLPQFHPIPENDRWWGRGFTEWTNVAKAQPLFDGHYQPHLPGELGFYDLRLLEVQQRQVELAKIYGVAAFCFYFYWFSGKRLLERPLDQWLANPQLDLGFCLCWANENWTRRWDGKDSEILIGQNHSPEDDLAFIAEVGPFLRDRRYVRIEGKPLLLVYRPALLPDAKATAERWRDWCRANGIGEILLAYTQSFETDDPQTYGFDYAIEFPPNQTGPREIAVESVARSPEEFRGRIYDWTSIADRKPGPDGISYPRFPGVCPSWDNTARRGQNATVLLGSEPRLFRDWVDRTAFATARQAKTSDESLLFVNAWNEWAEGAHLEPDRLYGYAHLEAVRQGLRLAAARRTPAIGDDGAVAVIIHAFYPEILDEILPQLVSLGLGNHVYITCAENGLDAVQGALKKHRISGAEVIQVRNRGRDVAPFLLAAARVAAAGFPLILKLHTKKSRHRLDGDHWRMQLYRELLGTEQSKAALDALRRPSGFGIVGPANSVVSMTWYRGSNTGRVRDLAGRMGVASLDERFDCFVAGTMFYARTEALEPLLALGLGEEDFEFESGQVDGTLAHALERAISYSALAAGYRVGELKRQGVNVVCTLPDPTAKSFHFAETSPD